MVESIGEELRSFYNFLQNPRQDIFKESFGANNFLHIISTYYIIFICGMIVLTPFAALAGLDSMPHKLEELKEMSIWALLFIAVLVPPVLEELFFRLPLKYPRGLVVLMFTFIGMIIFMGLAGPFPTVEEDQIPPVRIIIPLGFILIATLFLFIFYSSEKGIETVKKIVQKYFPHLFYTVAVYFAFVHFFNFETTDNQWLFTPVMVFPQFLMALFVGYARLKYGFLSAMVIHMINNLIPLLLMILTGQI